MTHVVIAEDDYGMLYLMKHLLRTLEWTCDAETNGVDAWQRVQEVEPDLVVSDINMPGMSGLDLVRAIKSDPRLAHIPVVLISSADNEAEAMDAGCDAFVAKPFGGQTILTLLPKLMGQEPSDQPNQIE